MVLGSSLQTSAAAGDGTSILDKARKLAALFEYTDADIQKCVPQVIEEMSMLNVSLKICTGVFLHLKLTSSFWPQTRDCAVEHQPCAKFRPISQRSHKALRRSITKLPPIPYSS